MSRELIDKAMSIPGMMRQSCCEYLFELSQRSGNLVEIGCYKGRSTATMLFGSQPCGGVLTSVDCFIPTEHADAASAGEWRDQLTKIGLTPPSLLVMTSKQAAGIYDKPIDLIFIDGYHSYNQVAEDILLWIPKIRQGGILALHDYQSKPGVTEAADELLENDKGWERLGYKGLVLALKKI